MVILLTLLLHSVSPARLSSLRKTTLSFSTVYPLYSGLNSGPPKRYDHILTPPVPINATLFGGEKRGFCKDNQRSPDDISLDYSKDDQLNSMTSVLIRNTQERQSEEGESRRKQEAEIGVMRSQTKKRLDHRKLEDTRKDSPPEPSKGMWS